MGIDESSRTEFVHLTYDINLHTEEGSKRMHIVNRNIIILSIKCIHIKNQCWLILAFFSYSILKYSYI